MNIIPPTFLDRIILALGSSEFLLLSSFLLYIILDKEKFIKLIFTVFIYVYCVKFTEYHFERNNLLLLPNPQMQVATLYSLVLCVIYNTKQKLYIYVILLLLLSTYTRALLYFTKYTLAQLMSGSFIGLIFGIIFCLIDRIKSKYYRIGLALTILNLFTIAVIENIYLYLLSYTMQLIGFTVAVWLIEKLKDIMDYKIKIGSLDLFLLLLTILLAVLSGAYNKTLLDKNYIEYQSLLMLLFGFIVGIGIPYISWKISRKSNDKYKNS